MVIEQGKVIKNKTWRYLVPCLKNYGHIFTEKFNLNVFKVAAGVYDDSFRDMELDISNSIFIVCERRVNIEKFSDFLTWIREQKYYVTDYNYDTDIEDSKYHMFVIRVPDRNRMAHHYFLKGEYSKMYTQQDIDYIFSSPRRKTEKDVLTLNPEFREVFIEQIQKEFKTKLESSDFSDDFKEFELPPKRMEEIFNCEEIPGRIYIDPFLDIEKHNLKIF